MYFPLMALARWGGLAADSHPTSPLRPPPSRPLGQEEERKRPALRRRADPLRRYQERIAWGNSKYEARNPNQSKSEIGILKTDAGACDARTYRSRHHAISAFSDASMTAYLMRQNSPGGSGFDSAEARTAHACYSSAPGAGIREYTETLKQRLR